VFDIRRTDQHNVKFDLNANFDLSDQVFVAQASSAGWSSSAGGVGN